MKKIKNGIILAGGNSDRFWPLIEKNVTTFLGKPLIDHIADQLSTYCEQVFIVTSSVNNDLIRNSTGNKHTYIQQNELQEGMAGAVLSCSKKVSGEVIIINASDYFNFEIIQEVVQKKSVDSVDAILVAKKVESYFPGGYLTIDGSTVISIVEKPPPQNTPSDLVNLVIDYFRDIDQFIGFLNKESHTKTDDWYERGLNRMMKEKQVQWVPYTDYWHALKYPWNTLSLMRFFLSQIKNRNVDPESVTIAASAVIESNVILQKGVKVGEFAKVSGPCFIGENTIIGDYALVRESHIGNNSLIGSYSEVARSYLANNVSLHKNYIGDSFLSDHVLFGAGAVTANFRFDEKEVFSYVGGKKIGTGMRKLGAIVGKKTKVGVNSVLFPGVKIGKNVLIGPNEKINKDIEESALFFDGVIKKI